MNHKTALERAFELADEGWSTSQIRAALLREGYDPHQLYGQSISSQLSKRIFAANGQVSQRGGQRRRT